MNDIELSRTLSYALRHAPWVFGLSLDSEGWVPVEELIRAIKRERKWDWLTQADLLRMVSRAVKKRFEISHGRIRALYGHSIPGKIQKREQIPPVILYHGTARRFLEAIWQEGLLPGKRQYVHLSEDMETAAVVGSRRDSEPVLLCVNALEASQNGVRFFEGNEKIWLSDDIPQRFLHVLGEEIKGVEFNEDKRETGIK